LLLIVDEQGVDAQVSVLECGIDEFCSMVNFDESD
jgi:hypothetical protein